MAVRFDNVTERLSRTTGLPSYDADYTVMAWIYIATHNGAGNGACVVSIDDQTDDVDEFYIHAPGASTLALGIVTLDSGDPQGDTGSATFAAGTWQHVAIVRSANNLRTGYRNGVSEVTHTRNRSGRSTPTSMTMGSVLDDDLLNGRIAAIKIWTAALSAAELANEMYYVIPMRTANLHQWHPCMPGASERLADYSGNGRNWTAVGTLTDEDGPPIAWAPAIQPIPIIASGTAYTQATSGTLTSAGAITKQANKVAAGTLTSAGAMVRSVAKSVAGTLTTAGAAIKQTAKSLAGTLATAGALVSSRLYSLAVAGTLTTAGALARQTNKLAAGTLTTAGSLARSIAKALAGTLTTAGALARSTAKSLAGALTTAGALVADFVTGGPTYTQAVEGTLTTAGTLSRSTSKALAGTLTTAGAITRQIAKSLAGTLTTVGALLRDWISPSAAKLDVTLTDARIYTCTLTDARTYTCTVADALAYTVTLGDSTT